MHASIAENTSATTILDIQMVVGSATATFEGVTSGSSNVTLGGGPEEYTLAAIVTVTVAGTFIMQARNSDALAATAFATSQGAGAFARATGYTAVKLA